MIKNQEMGLQDRKYREAMERKSKARQDLIQKILDENQRRLDIESEVATMEQDELELISRLQNTQMLQKAAYDDLESAISGGGSQM